MPIFRMDRDVSQVGFLQSDREATVKLFAENLVAAKLRAIKNARDSFSVAYRASVRRDRPFILLDDAGVVGIAPMPELIPWRITNGIYYDVVVLGDEVTNEISRRFEQYCADPVSYTHLTLPTTPYV